MKHPILFLGIAAFTPLLTPSLAQAEQPGLNHNVVLTGPIYGGDASKAQQKLGLGSRNSDLKLVGKRSNGKKFGFKRKIKKR